MKLKNRAVFLLRYGVDAETLGESVAIVTLAPVARTNGLFAICHAFL